MFHSLSDFIGQRLNVTIIQNILALFSAELINAPLINEDDQVNKDIIIDPLGVKQKVRFKATVLGPRLC